MLIQGKKRPAETYKKSIEPTAVQAYRVKELPEDENGNKAIIPTYRFCVISPLLPEEKTTGGIFLAPTTLDAGEFVINVGKIVAVGPQFYKHPQMVEDGELSMGVAPKVGDYVSVKRYTGERMEVNDSVFLVVRDVDILTKVNPAAFNYKFFA